MATIILASPSQETQKRLAPVLTEKGHQVAVQSVQDILSAPEPMGDIIILEDQKGPSETESLVRQIAAKGDVCVIAIVSGEAVQAAATCARLLRVGAADCWRTPLHPEEALMRVTTHLSAREYQEWLRSHLALDLETGAHSRWLFEKRLLEEYTKASRYPMPLSCLLVAVDRYDDLKALRRPTFVRRVLRELALLIQGSLRTSDFVARYEESVFAVLLPFTSAMDALVCAERIRGRAEIFPFREEETTQSVTVSVGVGGFSPKRTPDPQSLVNEAKVCLDFARAQGGDKVVADERYMPAWAQTPSSFDALIEDLRSGSELKQLHAYHRLREGGNAAVPYLIRALQDPKSDVRWYCVWALGLIAPKDGATAVARLLKDNAPEVRAAAAWALGRIGDRAAIPALIESIPDEDAQVRAAVGLSLSSLSQETVKPLVEGTPEQLRAECDKWRKHWLSAGMRAREE